MYAMISTFFFLEFFCSQHAAATNYARNKRKLRTRFCSSLNELASKTHQEDRMLEAIQIEEGLGQSHRPRHHVQQRRTDSSHLSTTSDHIEVLDRTQTCIFQMRRASRIQI